jgi:hemoglobin
MDLEPSGVVGVTVSRLPVIPPRLTARSRIEATPAIIDAESPECVRADLRDEDLHAVLVAFYASVADDPLLAPYFAVVDMAAHMPRIVAFWSTMLFHTGSYSGNAFRPHQDMPGLTAEHFEHWLATLERTVDAGYAGDSADRMKDLAHRIAYSMQLRLGITGGTPPKV